MFHILFFKYTVNIANRHNGSTIRALSIHDQHPDTRTRFTRQRMQPVRMPPPGSVLVVPSWRRILVVAPLAAAKPMRALSRFSNTPNRMFQWRRKDMAIEY